jgi:hypothetical protein
MATFIHGADRYGLHSDKDWKKLGALPVDVKVDVYRNPEPGIYRLPISRRRQYMRQRTRRLRGSLLRALGVASPSSVGSRRLRVRIPANRIPALSRRREVNSISVLRIQGKKPRAVPRPKSIDWYAVRARFAIRIEGKARHGWEDRILLVKAADFNEAERRARGEFRRYRSSYLVSHPD